jgi:hypothetical protein
MPGGGVNFGISEVGVGRDQRQLAPQASVQPLDQARARHQPWPDRGDIELGFQQGDGHFALPSGVLWSTSPVIQAPLPPLSYHILSIHTTLVKGRNPGIFAILPTRAWHRHHLKQNMLAPVPSTPVFFLDCPSWG